MSHLALGSEVAASVATEDARVALGSGMPVVFGLSTQTASAVGRRKAVNS